MKTNMKIQILGHSLSRTTTTLFQTKSKTKTKTKTLICSQRHNLCNFRNYILRMSQSKFKIIMINWAWIYLHWGIKTPSRKLKLKFRRLK